MSLESILDKIKAESRAECEAILQKAAKDTVQIKTAAQKEAEEERQQSLDKGEKEARRLRQRMLQLAELNARKEVLQLKQGLLDEVFGQALDKLNRLPAAEYGSLIKEMVLAQPLTGEEQLVVSAADKEYLGNGFLSRLNSALQGKGLKGRLRLSYDDKLPRGGFILRQDMVESNNTFSSLLRAHRDELELMVATTLFGEQQ